MSLQDQLDSDLKTALLARESLTVSTLRLLKAEISYASTTPEVRELDDPAIQQIIRREIKKRKDTIELLAAASPDQVQQAKEEIIVLQKYLPPETDPAAIESFIQECISSRPQKPTPGELIRETLTHFQGRADGKTTAEIVNRLLK